MKKTLSTLLLALLSLAASAYVDQGNLSTGLRWVLDDEYTLKVSGAGVIPDYGTSDIDGMIIMSGAPWGKTYYNKVKAIEVADGVTGIGKNAFNGMMAATSVKIAKSVAYIGDQAFMNCTKLTSAEVPSAVKSLGKYAFSGCSAMTSIVINGGLTIGERAFNGCTALKSMTYGGANPPGVLESVFARVPMSSGTLYVPAHAVSTYKATGVWNSWGTITAITSGKTDDGLTWNYSSGTLTINGVGAMGKYYIDNYDGVAATSAPWGPFYDKITKVEMSSTIFNIGDYAFYNMVNMSSLRFSPNMTKIGERALQYCDNLKSITLPATVGELGMYCFSPSGIRTINCEGHIPPMVEKSTCFNGLSNKSDATVNVPLGAVADYKSALGWSTFKNIKCPMEGWDNGIYWSVNEDFTELTLYGNGEMPYYGTTAYWDGVYATKAIWGNIHDKVKSIEVTGAITYISEGVFSTFTALEKVSLSPSVENVGTKAFNNCPSLAEMTVYAAVPPTVLTSTFSNTDTSGTLYVLPSAVDAYKASNWSVWKNILPISGGTVGTDLAWNVVDGVLTISGTGTMPGFNTTTTDGVNYVTSAPWGIFGDDITEVVIEEGVENIGSRCFLGMSSLKKVTMAESVTSVGDYAFYNTGIEEPVYNSTLFAYMPIYETNYTVPDGIRVIAPYAFYESRIVKVTLPATLTSIGDYAFAYCARLETVICMAVTPPAAESSVFGGTTKDYLGTLYVPDASVSLYRSASGWYGWGTVDVLPKLYDFVDGNSAYDDMIKDSPLGKVIYTRTYNGKWEALFLPMKLNVEALADRFEIARIIAVNTLDLNGDMKPDCKALQAKVMTEGYTEAEVPYLIRAKEAGEQAIELESDDAIIYSEAGKDPVQFSTLRESYTVAGTYYPITEGTYGSLVDGEVKPTTGCPAFRWVLCEYNAATSQYVAPSQPIIVMTTDDMATGVETLPAQENASVTIYNLQGQRLQKMQAGLNIVGGRKMMVK